MKFQLMLSFLSRDFKHLVGKKCGNCKDYMANWHARTFGADGCRQV